MERKLASPPRRYSIGNYLSALNVKTVRAMATSETATPTYPMISRERATDLEKLNGEALSNMAKCVRWVHSHTVKEVLDRTSFFVQFL